MAPPAFVHRGFNGLGIAKRRRLPGEARRAKTGNSVRCARVPHINRQAFRGDRPLRLALKEYAVLEVLMRAQGAVVSTEELLERAWDEHIDPFTTVVKVTMSKLRGKLGDPPVIVTVPGSGYRL